MQQKPESNTLPILKIGAVVFRDQGSGIRDRRILILQPIPKNSGDNPHFVLPRGTRQYQDEQGIWQDARDAATAEKYKEKLEPFTRGLVREVEEEAGVTPEMLAASRVTELGPLMFQSRTKGIYPIHWFMVEVSEETAQQMDQKTPIDALMARWATLDEIKEMASRGDFSAGYIPVIERALAVV